MTFGYLSMAFMNWIKLADSPHGRGTSHKKQLFLWLSWNWPILSHLWC